MAVDWTQLPQELLISIADNLKIYADYLRFCAVCHSWRSSVPNTPRHLPPQLPWLMLLDYSDESHGSSDRVFFDPCARKIRHLEVLEALSYDTRFCGSSHGWVVFLDYSDESRAVLLLNPLTQASLHLPPFSAYPKAQSFNYSEVDAFQFTFPQTQTLRKRLHLYIKKVVFSSAPLGNNNFIALAICCGVYANVLAYCKKGDETWTLIPRTMFSFADVVYYNGLFYGVDYHGVIAVCDINGASPIVSIIRPPLLFHKRVGAVMLYLVNSGDDELLLARRYVSRKFYDNGDLESYNTVWFEVFKMNWSEQRWDRVTNLGDRMLFIGSKSSVSFLASGSRGCLGNCIYFTEDDEPFPSYYFRIFKLSGGSFETCWLINPYGPSIWVTPNPC
ncbi:putative F-box protein At5g55150 [Corylus avellana]|uniref:putative F-box protein At5g55150 n=1 Tax=Corylus avellana TaxID=13451 RepID=UPI00286CC214|nr:putative F-box protein At5g55150 [Corylus avellana]